MTQNAPHHSTNRRDAIASDASLDALARRITKPIVLVGMMGVGKSSIGKRIASALNLPFVDADHAIEEASQLSIPEIFERFGEPYFRAGERRVIDRLVNQNKGVIAIGGGAFNDETSRALILERAISIWIDCPIEILVERTTKNNNRPLLKNGDPKAILMRLSAERAPYYQMANIHITSTGGPHEKTTNSVLKALDKWL